MIIEPVATFIVGQVAISSTVPTRIPAGDVDYKPQIGVAITALAGDIYFGGPNVTATNGYKIPGGQEEFLPLSTMHNLFFLAANNNDKIGYFIT
jgi:hypothetical protein